MSVTRAAVRNWRVKLAALSIAVLLWITMALSDDDVTPLPFRDVPVGVELRDEGWLLRAAPSPGEVEFTLTGPSSELLRVARAQPEVVIRVDSIQAEEMVVQLGPEHLRHPTLDQAVFDIGDFRPGSVRLLFERNAADDIPVSLRLTGELADSLSLVARPRASPLFARASGPKSAVDALEAVFLAPFDLGRVTESGRYEVEVDTTGMGGLAVSPATATVSVQVAPTRIRLLGPLPVRVADGFEVRPAELDVELTGASALLDRVDEAAVAVAALGAADELERALAETDSARVAVEVRGAPPLVRAAAAADSVTVRRAAR